MKKQIYFFLILSVLILPNYSIAKKRLSHYAYNVYSQFGEDGIIQKIFQIIGTQSKIAVEFGAWDGFYLSNTANLWSKDRLWKGILIEGDQQRYQELVKKTSSYNCLTINEWVGVDAISKLETILKNYDITQVIDLLSIDIDGNDYHIFESLETIRPRLVICEYNPTIPVTYDIYGDYSQENNFGCSVAALNRIAEKKGYKLVALTTTNVFFVLAKDFEKFNEFETDMRILDVNNSYITLVTTYDGKFALVSNKKYIYFYGINSPYKGNLSGTFVKWDISGSSIPAYYSRSVS